MYAVSTSVYKFRERRMQLTFVKYGPAYLQHNLSIFHLAVLKMMQQWFFIGVFCNAISKYYKLFKISPHLSL